MVRAPHDWARGSVSWFSEPRVGVIVRESITAKCTGSAATATTFTVVEEKDAIEEAGGRVVVLLHITSRSRDTTKQKVVAG